MESNIMKNIVILKNLPSNLVEEAFVVLKENEKIQIENLLNHETSKQSNGKYVNDFKEDDKEYIVKEAEMLIENYINDIERIDNETNKNFWKIKYEKAKILNIFLLVLFTISLIKCFI